MRRGRYLKGNRMGIDRRNLFFDSFSPNPLFSPHEAIPRLLDLAESGRLELRRPEDQSSDHTFSRHDSFVFHDPFLAHQAKKSGYPKPERQLVEIAFLVRSGGAFPDRKPGGRNTVPCDAVTLDLLVCVFLFVFVLSASPV